MWTHWKRVLDFCCVRIWELNLIFLHYVRHSFYLFLLASASPFNLNNFSYFVVFQVTHWIILTLIVIIQITFIELLYWLEDFFLNIIFLIRFTSIKRFYLFNWYILSPTFIEILDNFVRWNRWKFLWWWRLDLNFFVWIRYLRRLLRASWALNH